MIWAAVDVLDGRCVQLRGGDPKSARFHQDPLEAARRWIRDGADGIHLIDLNAALGSGDNRNLLETIVLALDAPVQVGGGVRDSTAVEFWLEAGAQRIIVGTRAVRDPAWLREIATRFPGRVLLALDARQGEVTVEGWTRGAGVSILDLARASDSFGLAAFLFTNVDVEGAATGFQQKPVRELCAAVKTPVLVSGGLRSLEDVHSAYRLGAAGVVLGTALYEGTIQLSNLKSAPKEEI